MLITISFSALAQQKSLEPLSRKQRLRWQYSTNDTAQAIITLYGRRQSGGVGWLVSSAVAAGRLAIGSNATIPGSPITANDNSSSEAAFFAVVPFAAYGVSKLVRFSNANLEETLAAYSAGQPLPHRLRRKLKPRFFSQPVIQYTPMQPAK